ncbi:MAG: DUF6377 domain-containing protein [Bacteroidota bacterium]
MRVRFLLLFLFILMACPARGHSDSVLMRLEEVIENRDYFVELKQSKIDGIKRDFLSGTSEKSPTELYNYFDKISREYQTFKFDSAFHYAHKMLEAAYQWKDKDRIAAAKTEFANILISAGIFSEAMDTLKSINLSDVKKATAARYYSIMSRGYFDMESFSQSRYYSGLYREKGMVYFDSALMVYPVESWEYQSMNAHKNIKLGNFRAAIDTLNQLINTYDLSNDELAIQMMFLSFAYGLLGDEANELKYMVDASVADFMGAKKEAVALFFVAGFLFEHGEVMKASKYINVALEETRFYGSNFRLWQISQYLPVIKSEHIVTIEDQKQKLWNYLMIVSVLSFIIVVSLVVIFRQMGKLNRVKNMLEASNKKLEAINEELLLANKIKEEYIGYYFSVSSQMIEKLEKFKNSIYRKFSRKQYDDLALELDTVNIHKEKLFLYNKFDQVFLQIFPDFVEKFNALLKDEEQFKMKEGHVLNTELRIFALIRLGITSNEKIAEILDYSVNTVYSYKTRVRNMARVPKDEFEQEVMKIKRF